MDDLFSVLTGRVEQAFNEHTSAGAILHRAVYEPLDGLLMSTGKEIRCSKGCDACCHRMVICTRVEALAVMEYLQGINKWDDQLREAVHLHASTLQDYLEPGENKPDTWIESWVACPFLKEGECLVYPMRPVSCRSYHSLDEPDLCKVPIRNVAQVKEINQAEELFSMMATMVGERIDTVFSAKGLFTLILDELSADVTATGEVV
ncbi:MAG TPA: YkgJ family cysteine cluster protein [Spirochaetota bacterium]|nr:YkgJ family cysteine cluster protein [Spirochaetota bacterium]